MAKRTPKPQQFPVLDLDARTDMNYLETLDKCTSSKRVKKGKVADFDPIKKLFSLFILSYFKQDGKALYLSPELAPAKKRSLPKDYREMCFTPDASRIRYHMSIVKKDGSKVDMVAPPPGIFEHILEQVGSKLGLMDYNPYSDREQKGTFNARFGGKDNLLDLYVRQTRYGREIVVKRAS